MGRKKANITPAKVEAPLRPDISTFSVRVGQEGKQHWMEMGGECVWCDELTKGVTDLLGILGIDQKFVEDAPESEGKTELLALLSGSIKKRGKRND